MDFARESDHTARKEYRCNCCLKKISPGERITRWAGVTDGLFQTAIMHPDCHAVELQLNLMMDLNEDEWAPLHDLVREGGKEMLDDAPESVRARFLGPESAA